MLLAAPNKSVPPVGLLGKEWADPSGAATLAKADIGEPKSLLDNAVVLSFARRFLGGDMKVPPPGEPITKVCPLLVVTIVLLFFFLCLPLRWPIKPFLFWYCLLTEVMLAPVATEAETEAPLPSLVGDDMFEV